MIFILVIYDFGEKTFQVTELKLKETLRLNSIPI